LQALAALAEAAVAGKRIVLLDRYIGLDASLEPSTTRVYDRPERAGRRLRNGRWVE